MFRFSKDCTSLINTFMHMQSGLLHQDLHSLHRECIMHHSFGMGSVVQSRDPYHMHTLPHPSVANQTPVANSDQP